MLSVAFNMLLVRYASFFGLVDIPNERSTHKKAIPRGAGISMFLSVMLSLALFNLDYLYTYYLIYLAISIVFIIGFIDDVVDTSPRLKLLFTFIASIILSLQGIYIHTLGYHFGYEIILPIYFAIPFSIFAIMGLTNAVNLIDGLDGLAGTISLIILSTFFTIGYQHHDILIATLSGTFVFALIVFLFFNWNPAEIFMGDSGSLTLGFVISTLSILSMQYVSPISILFIVALPLLDTFIVMTRRIQRGQSPFRADKNHLHHFLLNLKGDVRFTVVLLATIQLAFSLIGFQLHDTDNAISLIIFAALFFIFLNLFDQRLQRQTKANKSKQEKKIKKYKRQLRGEVKDMMEDDITNPTEKSIN